MCGRASGPHFGFGVVLANYGLRPTRASRGGRRVVRPHQVSHIRHPDALKCAPCSRNRALGLGRTTTYRNRLLRPPFLVLVATMALAGCKREDPAREFYSVDAIFRRAADREEHTRRRVERLPQCSVAPRGDSAGWTRPLGSWYALPPEVSGVPAEPLYMHGGQRYRSPDGRFTLYSLGVDDLEGLLLQYRAQGDGLVCQLRMPDGQLAIFVRQDMKNGSRAAVWPVVISPTSGGSWALHFVGPDSSAGDRLLQIIQTYERPRSDSGATRPRGR